MAGIQISGLLSNSAFDWKAVVDQLVAIETIPITNLEKQQAKNTEKIEALGTLQTAMQDLKDSLQAMRADDDEEKWHSSGAETFTAALFDIIHRIIDEGHPEPDDAGKPAITPDPADETEVGQSLIARTFERLTVIRNTPVVKILPRRVEAKTERLLRTERPTAETGPTLVTFADSIVGTGEAMAASRVKMS